MAVEKAKNVPPFVLWCSATIPTAFDDSMSYYEALCALYKWVQDNIIGVVNNNADVLKEYAKEVEALKKYVDDYFKNLDVQEEINNKLDEMAEGGQLAEIIVAYLQMRGVLAYDTIADMKAAENIIDGSTCLCLGDESYDDGKMEYFKIREKLPSDVVDEDKIVSLSISDALIAEKIENIKFEQLADLIEDVREDLDETIAAPEDMCKVKCGWSYTAESYYSMVKIPRNQFSMTNIPYETTGYDGSYKYVENNPNSVYINGQLSSPTVINGVVTRENPTGSDEYWYFFGIDTDGNPKFTKDINRSLTGSGLVALGYKEAFGIWSPLIVNGTDYVPSTDLNTSDANYDYIVNQNQPRSIIGYDNDYWYLVIVEGRLPRSKGTDYAKTQLLLHELGINNAFNMDGGSNVQLWLSNPTTNLAIKDNSRYTRGYTSQNVVSLLKLYKITGE